MTDLVALGVILLCDKNMPCVEKIFAKDPPTITAALRVKRQMDFKTKFDRCVESFEYPLVTLEETMQWNVYGPPAPRFDPRLLHLNAIKQCKLYAKYFKESP